MGSVFASDIAQLTVTGVFAISAIRAVSAALATSTLFTVFLTKSIILCLMNSARVSGFREEVPFGPGIVA